MRPKNALTKKIKLQKNQLLKGHSHKHFVMISHLCVCALSVQCGQCPFWARESRDLSDCTSQKPCELLLKQNSSSGEKRVIKVKGGVALKVLLKQKARFAAAVAAAFDTLQPIDQNDWTLAATDKTSRQAKQKISQLHQIWTIVSVSVCVLDWQLRQCTDTEKWNDVSVCMCWGERQTEWPNSGPDVRTENA